MKFFAPKEGHDPYAALRIRDFRVFLFSRIALTIGMQMQAVIVGWQVYDLTKDPFALGLTGLAEVIPALLVALYAGHVSDVVSRHRVVLFSRFALALSSVALLLISFNIGSVTSTAGLWPIYLVIGWSGLAKGFLGPSGFAFISELVPRSLYPNASAWGSSSWQGAAVVGPALGGLLYGYFGVTATYGVDAALTMTAASLLLLIPPRPAAKPDINESIAASIRTGVDFVFKNQIILAAISLDLFAVLFGGAVALLPVFAKDILHVGPEGLGILRSAPAVGAVIVAVAFAHRPLQGKVGRQLLIAVAGFGAAILTFGLSTNFYLSLIALFFSGAFDSVSVIFRSIIMQVKTPNAMRGRVTSVERMFITSSNEIGAFESGTAASLLGTVPSVIFGATMTILIVVATSIFAPSLRELRSEELLQEEIS